MMADNSVGHVKIFARAVSNPGPPDYNFGNINDMPFTTPLSEEIAWSHNLMNIYAREIRTGCKAQNISDKEALHFSVFTTSQPFRLTSQPFRLTNAELAAAGDRAGAGRRLAPLSVSRRDPCRAATRNLIG